MQKKWLLTGLVLAVIAGTSYALYLYLQPQRLPDQLLYGNGHIEGTEVRVAAEVGGRVVESRLVEGGLVGVGALLVRIDDVDIALRNERAIAEIEILRRSRERADYELQIAHHHRETAERDLARYRALRERNASPPQQLERAENSFQEARGRAGALAAEIGVIDGRIEAAQKELSLLENELAKTHIVAPIAGTVLAKAVEAGEFSQPGQTIAVLVDLSRLELRAFIPERDIGKITLNAPARVRVDAFPDRLFEGRVSRVDQQAQFTPRDVHMPQERTRMVFGVTITLENPDRVLKPGMLADAWILWRSDAAWPDQLLVPR
ncbi:MAG TPA: efflux RND transporter periplasmic adaptor subunit [Alphaproteobacteria bacterium]|nr:efflux RND transporter periplasmic adaptor subunit [Alphaproteobacteria bacterium]